MPTYRLTYPATIYVDVDADNLDAAKQTLIKTLDEVQDGIIITLDIDQESATNEILYPDSDKQGSVSAELVGLEDVDGEEAARYKATIEPQAWQNDYAIPVDAPGPTSWDCTAYVYGPEQPGLAAQIDKAIADEGHFLDRDDLLMNDPAAPEWVRHWTGPFTITVQRP